MTNDIKIKYIPYKQIGEIAQKVLAKYEMGQRFPIDIDNLVDNILRINIIPFPDLYRNFEISAFTSCDLKKIYIDQYLYDNLDKQYRFTIAHEFGHATIHKEIYKLSKIEGLDSYRDFIHSIDNEEYQNFEYQADCFAGHFLVPSKQLEEQFNKYLSRVINLKKTVWKNTKREHYIDIATTVVATEISPFFNVHPTVVKIRLEKDHLSSQIP